MAGGGQARTRTCVAAMPWCSLAIVTVLSTMSDIVSASNAVLPSRHWHARRRRAHGPRRAAASSAADPRRLSATPRAAAAAPARASSAAAAASASTSLSTWACVKWR